MREIGDGRCARMSREATFLTDLNPLEIRDFDFENGTLVLNVVRFWEKNG